MCRPHRPVARPARRARSVPVPGAPPGTSIPPATSSEASGPGPTSPPPGPGARPCAVVPAARARRVADRLGVVAVVRPAGGATTVPSSSSPRASPSLTIVTDPRRAARADCPPPDRSTLAPAPPSPNTFPICVAQSRSTPRRGRRRSSRDTTRDRHTPMVHELSLATMSTMRNSHRPGASPTSHAQLR